MNEEKSIIISRISLDNEPQGRPMNLIWLGGAGAICLQAIVFFIRDGHFALSSVLFITMFGILGIAESLPPSRQRVTFSLRILGIAMAVIVILLSMVGLFGGPNLLF